LVTANHCFTEPDDDTCRQNGSCSSGYDDSVGHLDQDKSSYEHLNDADGLFDASSVIPDATDVKYKLADDNPDEYRGHPIVGSISDARLHFMEDGGKTMSKQGARTGITSGDIQEIFDNHFETDINTNNGDSGCPAYEHRCSSYGGCHTYIGGILSASDNNTSYFTKMNEIEARFNLTV